MPQLSDSQLVVLTAACQRPDRCVFPVTAKLKGNAAGNVLKSLLNKGLIKEVRAKRDDTVWRHDEERGRMTLVATKAAFAALGIDAQETPAEDETESAPNDTEDAGEEPKAQRKAKSRASRTAAPRSWDGSKQAQLIAMLRRAKGATVDEIAEALSWQPHTVRGAIAGALKKKLSLDVTSEKDDLLSRGTAGFPAAGGRSADRRPGPCSDRGLVGRNLGGMALAALAIFLMLNALPSTNSK